MRVKRGARNGTEEGRGDGINRDKSVGEGESAALCVACRGTISITRRH